MVDDVIPRPGDFHNSIRLQPPRRRPPRKASKDLTLHLKQDLKCKVILDIYADRGFEG